MEAQIANVSDELAYNAHDLDDGMEVGCSRLISLMRSKSGVNCVIAWVGRGSIDEVTRHRFIREQIGMQVDDVLTTTMKIFSRLIRRRHTTFRSMTPNRRT